MSYLESTVFSFDWLNGTLPGFCDVRYFFDCLEKIHADLKYEEWFSRERGIYNYSQSFGLQGSSRFIVAFNPDYDNSALAVEFSDNFNTFPLRAVTDGYNPGIFISISGDGLRYLNSLGNGVVKALFSFLRSQGFKASRLDVCCDIFDKDNPLVPLLVEAFHYCIVKKGGKATLTSNIRRTVDNVRIQLNADPYRENNDWSYSIAFGNHGSSWGMFRLYDKWLEIKTGRLKEFSEDLLKDKDYWYRLEYELHKEHAALLFNNLGDMTTSDAFHFAACNMFKVVIPKSEKTQSDKCINSSVWAEFLEYIHCIHFV